MAENDSTSPAARNSFLTVPTFFDLQREVVYQNVWPSENWKNSRSSSELALRARPKLTEIGPKPVSQVPPMPKIGRASCRETGQDQGTDETGQNPRREHE